MGDYLNAKVRQSRIKYNKTTAVLRVDGHDSIRFELPVPVDMRKGDNISFYQGTFTADSLNGDRVTHSDYITAEVHRRGKQIMTLEARDMRILQELRTS